jgi:hypothetical protein
MILPHGAAGFLRKRLTEYGRLEGHESTYYKLGCAYRDLGKKEEALKAFEECLALGAGRHNPDEYPLKDAREQIRRINGQ